MSPDSVLRFGRVVVDGRGITQRRLWGFLGRSFTCPWAELSDWAAVDVVRRHVETGKDVIVGGAIELRWGDRFEILSFHGRLPAYRTLAETLRQRTPGKETGSVLEKVSAIRNRQP